MVRHPAALPEDLRLMLAGRRNPFDVTKAVDYSDGEIYDSWVDLDNGGFAQLVDPTSSTPQFLLGGKGTGRTHLMRPRGLLEIFNAERGWPFPSAKPGPGFWPGARDAGGRCRPSARTPRGLTGVLAARHRTRFFTT